MSDSQVVPKLHELQAAHERLLARYIECLNHVSRLPFIVTSKAAAGAMSGMATRAPRSLSVLDALDVQAVFRVEAGKR